MEEKFEEDKVTIFSDAVLQGITKSLQVLKGNLVISEQIIDSEAEFQELYEKSRGCIMKDDWCLFFTSVHQKEGTLHKFSKNGILAMKKKYDI
jgi:hypothetical protein